MKPTLDDPVIDEVREVRHNISARFNHSAARLVEYYQQMQEQYRDRLRKPDQASNAIVRSAESA